MARKRKSVKKIQQEAKEPRANFTKHLDKGFEDPQFPHSRGTMQELGKDFGDEIGLLSSTPSSQGESELGMLVFGVLVAAAFTICFMAFI